MVKSFKKAIACLLAVLMVACAMPFTAFAATTAGTVNPNVVLRFSTFYDTAKGYYDNATCGDTVEKAVKSSMLYDAPLTYNYTKTETGGVSGNLVLEAAKTQGISDFLEIDPLEEDIEYGVGNFFAVSVNVQNLPTLFTGAISLKYSNNIEPAGVYSKTAKRQTTYYILGESAATGYDKTSIKAREPITDMSCATWYPGLNDTALGDLSGIKTDDEDNDYISCAFIAGEAIDVSTAEDDFTNPETGDMMDAYVDEMIGETFVFKIVGDGPINFEVYDPQDTIEPGSFRNNYFAPTKEDGAAISYLTTYALGTNGEGAGKMTFMGMNANTGEGLGEEQECTHDKTTVVNKKDATCTETGYTGDTKCDSCGATIANGETIKALGHDMQEVANSAVAATCETAGKEADTKCSRCEEATTGDRIDPIGHKYGEFAHVADTNTHAKVCANDASHVVTENCEFTSSVKTEPTYTVMGWTTYTCKVCDNTYDAQDIPVKTCDHAKTTVVNAKEATCTEAGYTGDTKCDACGATVSTGNTIEALGHDMQVVPGTAVTATCKADGKEADMACSRGDKTETGKTISKSTVAHTSQTVNGKAATCTEPGLTAGAICSVCETVLVEQTEIDPLGHKIVSANNAVAATCTTDGKESDTKCSVCLETLTTGKTIKATGHSFTNYVSDNNATVSKNGTKTAVCDNGCGTSDTIEDEDSALGVNVTINDANDSFGDVTPAYGTTNYAFGSTVTLTAAPLEDCVFVGWQVADKLVSTEKTYTFTAYTDITITPVFTPATAAEDKISVIFYDKYNNVVAEYKDVTVADYQAAVAAKLPTAPVYAGYTFDCWSMKDADIKALDKSATINAYYTEDKAQGFTVETTADATLTIDAKRVTGEITATSATGVQFDTKVTVTAPGATAWTVDGATVGYGESYTFFVGSDIMIEPVFDAVEENPAVAMIKAYKIAADSHKIMFLASMNVPSTSTLVDHGFVYGKNMIASDLVLENVGNKGTAADAGEVKKTSAGTNTVEQFGISYGITKQTGKACAVAYLTFIKDGEMQTIYSEGMAYDYDLGNSIPVDEAIDD